MRIVVDAMGSDAYPVPDVAGAVLAAREYRDTEIILAGNEQLVQTELAKHDTAGLNITVAHASEVVTMTDKPGVVGKAKPNSSMHVGMNLVRDGQADAFVTAGNTGAALSIATLHTLRRIPGVKRPALSAVFRLRETPVMLVDAGANADAKPDWLAQFALMGHMYAEHSLKLKRPRVGILSNGEEEGKGSELVREASDLIARLPVVNFIGNVEPKDMLRDGVDVVVADGFVGNITIKTLEAATREMGKVIREEIMRSTRTKVGGLLARPAFERVYKQIDPFEIGGAPLLGVNGVVIIGHGRSNDKAVKNAINQARQAVDGDIINAIKVGLV